ncbi:SWIRM domain-containing protein [Rhizoctonia solani AG-1 IA]|uniref:SWIRM domain-containing protein n=1 Tax=Thanatephorus cucumeris (strain AG1-IA) TaxID=983506 RepID=L8WLH9_THACA|nr:SWIRM domain-containing protein [Rhizoctonia solani AG-1 IA]
MGDYIILFKLEWIHNGGLGPWNYCSSHIYFCVLLATRWLIRFDDWRLSCDGLLIGQIQQTYSVMTTKARSPGKSAPESEEVHVGEAYTCDACNVDLTRNVRIKCAAVGCEEVDLCPTCFCAGKEPDQHKAWHDYRVVGRHSYPILVEDWGADESILRELQLLDGLSKCGMGNWSAVAELIGTRTAEEVEQHYTECYINSTEWPLPRLEHELDVDYETFQERKKQRIINLRESLKKKAGPTQPFVSGPTNHEVGGFMPGRREFEHEAENEAEDLVKDLEFGIVMDYGGDQQPDDEEKPEGDSMDIDVEVKVENESDAKNSNADDDDEPQIPAVPESTGSMQLKLTLLDMYNEKLDARIEAKAIVLERGLTDHKRERDRSMGTSRNGFGHRSSVPPGGETGQSRIKDESSLAKSSMGSRRPAAPLNLANAQSLHLLTPAEQTLCAALRILPIHFLGIKETLVRECVRRGGRLRRREARELVRIDVHKTGQIWDFLVRTGVLKLAPDVAPATDAAAAGSENSAGANPWTSLPASSLGPGQALCYVSIVLSYQQLIYPQLSTTKQSPWQVNAKVIRPAYPNSLMFLGERLSPYVSLACIAMAATILLQ